MDRKSFIDIVSERIDAPKETVSQLIDAFRDILSEKCSESDSVALPSFGTFEPRKMMERIAIHPASGKRLLVPPKITLSFKPSAILKQKLNSEPQTNEQ